MRRLVFGTSVICVGALAVVVATALMPALFAPAHLEGAFGSHSLEPHTDSSTVPPAVPSRDGDNARP